MRSNTAVTFVQHADRAAPRIAPPRRLLSVAELVEALPGAIDARAVPAHGPAWRDVRVVSLTFGGCGEATLPPAAFYSVLGSAREMVVANPGDAMRMRWTQPYRATLACIEPRVLSATAAECGLGAVHPELRGGAGPMDGVCERLLGALAEEGNVPAYPLQERVVESIARALAYRLVMRFDAEAAHVGARGALNPRAFREVSSYIEQHLDERLSLDELARVAGVSRFHFARQFRLRTGESPMGFLLRARIERGKTLLRAGAVSIGDVAATLGFSDQSHFTRTFKRLVGVPPSEYKGGARPAHARGAPATASAPHSSVGGFA